MQDNRLSRLAEPNRAPQESWVELELRPEQKKLENEVYIYLKERAPLELDDGRLTHIAGDGPVCRQLVRKLGLDRLDESTLVFHAGEQGQISTGGGSVLIVVATAETVVEAQSKVYLNVPGIHLEGCHYLKGIAARELLQRLGFDTTFNKNPEGGEL
jgi:hypothetical protein